MLLTQLEGVGPRHSHPTGAWIYRRWARVLDIADIYEEGCALTKAPGARFGEAGRLSVGGTYGMGPWVHYGIDFIHFGAPP